MTNEPAGAYSLSLLSAELLSWHRDELAERLGKAVGAVEVVSSEDPGQLFQVQYVGHRPGGSATPGAVVFRGDVIDRAFTEKALRQTWDWPEARAALGRCRQAVLVLDRGTRQLPYRIRWQLMGRLTAVLVAMASPRGGVLALHAPLCQLLVDPAAFLEGQRAGPEQDHLCGAFNVRLFPVEDQRPGDLVMDTLGLAALGLPDLQCHFNGADPGAVARLLCGYAYQLFESGDVIEDGQAVAGLLPGQHWVCRHELSLAEPERVVLDLNPGPDYAAEGR